MPNNGFFGHTGNLGTGGCIEFKLGETNYCMQLTKFF